MLTVKLAPMRNGAAITVGRGTYLLYLRDMKSLVTLVATVNAKKPTERRDAWTSRMAMFLNINAQGAF
jgi:hypothetical protein